MASAAQPDADSAGQPACLAEQQLKHADSAMGSPLAGKGPLTPTHSDAQLPVLTSSAGSMDAGVTIACKTCDTAPGLSTAADAAKTAADGAATVPRQAPSAAVPAPAAVSVPAQLQLTSPVKGGKAASQEAEPRSGTALDAVDGTVAEAAAPEQHQPVVTLDQASAQIQPLGQQQAAAPERDGQTSKDAGAQPPQPKETVQAIQHEETSVSEPAAQPQTPHTRRVTSLSPPSDMTAPSHDTERSVQNPALIKPELQPSKLTPGADTEAPAVQDITPAMTVRSRPRVEPDRPAAVQADVSGTSTVPELAVGRDEASMLPPPQSSATQAAAGLAPSCSPAPGAKPPLCSEASAAVSDAAPQQRAQQEGALQGQSSSLAALAASQEAIPAQVQPQQPDDGDSIDPDDIDIEASDGDAAPAQDDAAAAAAAQLARLALRKEARLLLAQTAGCSRAVPQHAVVLTAGLGEEGSEPAAARCGASEAVNAWAETTQHRRVVAACWRDQAERSGCARAASRADVTALVGLLSPAAASAAESSPFKVSIVPNCVVCCWLCHNIATWAHGCQV